MRLDHVSYAAGHRQLADVVQRLGLALGAAFCDGGRHPRFGTRNFVLPLGDRSYIEVVSPLDHPCTDLVPFGQAVLEKVDEGGGWLGWAVAVPNIAVIERRLGRSAVAGNRRLPDGVELRWRQIGVKALVDDPQLPFFVEWEVAPHLHPANGAHSDLRIEKLEIAGDRSTMTEWLGCVEEPLPNVTAEWVQAERPGLVAVHVATRHGVVRLE